MPRDAQPAGDAFGVGDGETVDDAAAGELRQILRQPREARRLIGNAQVLQPQRIARQRPTLHQHVGAELRLHIVHDAIVGGRRRRHHRHPLRQHSQDPHDATIVGPKIVPPVRDAMSLIDHEQPNTSADARQHVAQKMLVVEPFRRNEEHVASVLSKVGFDRPPVIAIAAVQGVSTNADPFGHLDLIAHQREQRTDEQRRPRVLFAQQLGRQEVDETLAPPGALHDEQSAFALYEALDRFPLPGAKRRGWAVHGAEQILSMRKQGGHGSPRDEMTCMARASFTHTLTLTPPDGANMTCIAPATFTHTLTDIAGACSTWNMETGEPSSVLRSIILFSRRSAGSVPAI